MHLRTRSRAILLVAPTALVLAAAAACGSAAASPSTTSAAAPPSATSSAGSGSTGTSADALMVTSNQTFGQIVTTGAGKTVYRYDLDKADAPKSNCTGACASLWSPVMAPSSGAPMLSGISASAVGETTAANGGKQLTLAGWPLYTYVGDTAAGQATGQASGGTWWVVSPTGAKITTSAAGGAATSNSGTTAGSGAGGYGY